MRAYTAPAILLLAIVLGACTFPFPGSGHERHIGEIGVVADGIDVPQSVLDSAKAQVEQYFEMANKDFPSYAYVNWRIESLKHSYVYESLNGMRLVIFQLNYEFLSELPENIMLVGGMYMTEDNWVMPSYPNSTYLIFQQEDQGNDALVFLEAMMVNDSYPGEPIFTDDLRRALPRT